MAKSILEWDGAAVMKSMDAQTVKALTKAAILVENAAVKNVNSQVYSTPESPNYKRSGDLRASITRAISRFNAYVSAAMEYALWVEKGTKYMKARPYLYPALLLNKEKILSIFKTAFKGSKYID